MSKVYDATKEHAKFEKTKSKDGKKGHPNKGIKGKNPFSGNSK